MWASAWTLVSGPTGERGGCVDGVCWISQNYFLIHGSKIHMFKFNFLQTNQQHSIIFVRHFLLQKPNLHRWASAFSAPVCTGFRTVGPPSATRLPLMLGFGLLTAALCSSNWACLQCSPLVAICRICSIFLDSKFQGQESAVMYSVMTAWSRMDCIYESGPLRL